MTDPPDNPLQRFSAEADAFTDQEALTTAARAAAAPEGVTAVSANLLLVPGRAKRPDMLIGDDRWREWAPRYHREKLSEHDPALQMTRICNRPFTWSQARERFRTERSDYVLDACRETTGFADAVVVPVRDTDGALLTTTFLSPTGDFDPAALARLHLAGFYYATRGREIVHGFMLEARSPLTPRETECLELVWNGKSDDEIAVILRLSPNTVHHHVESARRKLAVPKRFLAAKEAWRRGLII